MLKDTGPDQTILGSVESELGKISEMIDQEAYEIAKTKIPWTKDELRSLRLDYFSNFGAEQFANEVYIQITYIKQIKLLRNKPLTGFKKLTVFLCKNDRELMSNFLDEVKIFGIPEIEVSSNTCSITRYINHLPQILLTPLASLGFTSFIISLPEFAKIIDIVKYKVSLLKLVMCTFTEEADIKCEEADSDTVLETIELSLGYSWMCSNSDWEPFINKIDITTMPASLQTIFVNKDKANQQTFDINITV